MDTEYEQLLSIFKKFHEENDKKKKDGTHDYSLINALLKITDEVNLHSNFIYSMINPKSSHYCENIFLELFLKSIDENGFINLDRATVHKEKGKIDLLIEDGHNIIIIENKLRAVDQKHQISRYIKYVCDKYIDETDSVDDRIHIVYLSEYKEIPKGNSAVGFKMLDVNHKKLIWDNKDIYFDDETTFKLKDNTELKFNRVRHSQELLKWVKLSKCWLKKNNPTSSSLIYAFDEYELILKRLDTTKQWRKIMELDDYILSLAEKEKEMYDFMERSSKAINSYKGKKLHNEIDTLDINYIDIEFGEKKLQNFSSQNCINWFKKKGSKEKYRDVGCEINIDGEKYILALGVNNIAFGKHAEELDYSDWFKKNILSKREENIFITIEFMKKKLN